MATATQVRKPYPADLTDAQGTMLAPLLPAARTQHGGRPRTRDLGDVVKTRWSLNRRGGQGAMLPHDLLPTRGVYDYWARWRAEGTWVTILQARREPSRARAGREPTPRAVGSDSPAVKTTEIGGAERGAAGGQQSHGRTRQLWGDPLGLGSVVLLTSAALADGVAAPKLLQWIEPHDGPRLKTSLAAHQDHHPSLQAWRTAPRPAWPSAVKTRPAAARGFPPRENRWVVERTQAWHGRYRRHRTDDERTPEASAALRYLRNIHLLLRRLTAHSRPAVHDRDVAAEPLKLAS